MKTNKPTKEYKPQKLSKLADLRIRYRLFKVFLRKSSEDLFVSPKLLAGTLVVAMLVVFVAPGQIDQYRIAKFIERAEAAQEEFESKKENSIYHHKYRVSEGKGKASYVSKQTGIPIRDAARVALRHDVIEEWSHGITNFSHIETDVAGRPLKVVLNLENEDHMHIFEYSPEDCEELLKDGITTSGCEKRSEVTESYLAHRTTFDSVHDIESLYSEDVSYQEESMEPISIRELTFRESLVEGNNEYMVFSALEDNIEERYYFDSETYLLQKKVVAIIEGTSRYEMSEIEELERTFVEADKWDEVFDPTKYSFEQVDVFPI